MTRIIAKLDVKPPYLVKPIHFEGLRKLGSVKDFARDYYDQGADEIFYLDIVASLFQRNFVCDLFHDATEKVFVPVAAGGGLRSVDDLSTVFHSGADKAVLNTFSLQHDPELIDSAAKAFGSQSVVVNIEAKYLNGEWICYSDCGRIPSNKRVLEWVDEIQSRGAGEILLQSIDKDGKRSGFDLPLIEQVLGRSKIPVVAASGAGSTDHILELLRVCRPSGIAVASILHNGLVNIREIKELLKKSGSEQTCE